MTKTESEQTPSEAQPREVRQRIGFMDGKYPPMSLEDFNAYNDEIAEWFYESSIFPDAEPAEPDVPLTSSSSPCSRRD